MKTEPAQTLDFSPLEEPVSHSETFAIIKAEVMGSIAGLIFVVLFVLGFLSIVSIIASAIIAVSGAGAGVPHVLMFGFLIIVPAIIYFSLVNWAKEKVRLERFVQRNGFGFTKNIKNPGLDGAIFQTGTDRVIENHINGVYAGQPFWMGNYSYTVSSGKNSTTYTYGVIGVELQRKLPHTLLDARSNNFLSRVSNLPSTFTRDQKFQLEGDFGKYFDLYAPKEYERDILYFLTPELMALLIDKGANYDIEIIDNNLYIYHEQKLRATPDGMRNAFELIQSIGGEVSENTIRYADERVGSRAENIVADPGKRLKRSSAGYFFLLMFIIYFIFVSASR